SATVFRSWPAELPEVECRAAQLPARQHRLRERGLTTIDEIAGRLAEAIAALPPKPLAIYGHSLGALIGFELVRRLEASGGAVAALIVGARRGPFIPRREPPIATLPEGAFIAAF